MPDDQVTSPPVKLELELGSIKVQVTGENPKELSTRVAAALKAINENAEMLTTLRTALGIKSAADLSKSTVDTIAQGSVEEATDDPFALVAKAAKVEPERLRKVLSMRNVPGVSTIAPVLLARPDAEDAVYVTCYALQVGLKSEQMDVTELKRILAKGSGYPLPGHAFGWILRNIERRKHAIRTQTQKNYKPLLLSTPGLEKAAAIIKKLCDEAA
jgi:hypothetical protein